MRSRMLLVVMALGLSVTLSTSAQAAVTTPFNATFDERTRILVCPLGSALELVCFRGEGNGTATPPGGPARHVFTGHLLPTPNLSCPDEITSWSTGTIQTSAGNVHFSATGSQCPPPLGEEGTWQATGGTGIFAGATGGGTYITDRVFIGLDLRITSRTRYFGTLSLAG
jgi:hypothetical protein